MSEKWSDAIMSRTPSPTDVLTLKEEEDLSSRTSSPSSNGTADAENGLVINSEESNENFNSSLRKRKFSSTSSSSSESKKPLTKIETDPVVLKRRQKDIDYGKNTIGYDNYVNLIPKTARTDEHPRTPPMYKKMSRRNWDATVKKWRVLLHHWDPVESKNSTDSKKTTVSESKVQKLEGIEEKVKIETESDSRKESEENLKIVLEEQH